MKTEKPAFAGRETVRDLGIMARRGDGFFATAKKFGWSDYRMQRICRDNAIFFRDAPRHDLPKPDGGRARSASLDSARGTTIAFQTTCELRETIAREGRKRGIANSKLVHDVLAAVDEKGLWPELLGEAAP